MRPDSSGVIFVRYGCWDCEFGGDSLNGVGLASQHAEANPEHEVWAEQVTSMTWNEDG